MSQTITVSDLAQPGQRLAAQWVDVRSASEFCTGHIPGAVNIPLDEVDLRRGDLDEGRPIVLICQSGVRARMIAEVLAGCRSNVAVLQGGTKAWKDAGLPLVQSARSRWSLERQVRLGAGTLIVLGIFLAAFVSPLWLGLAAFVGIGLCFAGLTDICPMGILLSRMPWNVRPCRAPGAPAHGAPCCS